MCPRCHSHEIHRSKSWRFRDVVMVMWDMKPFRCEQCRKRFYLPSRLEPGITAEREWLHKVRDEKDGERHHRDHRSR